jgi:hypothetical protein
MSTPQPDEDALSEHTQAMLTHSLPEWEAGLLAHFREHGKREGEALAAYERFAKRNPEDFVRYLGKMLLDDERRHHRMFDELANALIGSSKLIRIAPDIPPLSPLSDAAELQEQTARLLDIEKTDHAELHRLRKDLEPVKQVTLWELLIRLAELDTQKHITILRFISDAARREVRKVA